MSGETTNLEVLSTRSGFNQALRYITKTIEISGSLGSGANLGDLLYEKDDENLSGERGGLLLRMLLVDKLGYKAVSSNLVSVAEDIAALSAEFEKWKAVDMVAAYHHPNLGLLIANPKIAGELAGFGLLRKCELLVIYAGKGSGNSGESCRKAAELALDLFQGKKIKVPQELLKGGFTVKKVKKAEEDTSVFSTRAKKSGAAKVKYDEKVKRGGGKAAAPVISRGPVQMTPMYSVVVSNELFHNGNVEAWKKIVESYKARYPALQVYIYYEGERILDINSLFKWGKVKHGSAIQFAVAGNEIKDVAKLRRYLVQGASHQFEAFLHGSRDGVLKLFG